MQSIVAPFADIPIAISLMSTTGLKYRTFNCYECGQPFMDREGDHFYRANTPTLPEEAHFNADGVIPTICGRCSQRYTVTVALNIQNPKVGIPLYMQPQSIYLGVEPAKHFRDTFCFECGKAYFSISDRIRLVVDNVLPDAMVDASKPGAMEARCNWRGCKARWHIRM